MIPVALVVLVMNFPLFGSVFFLWKNFCHQQYIPCFEYDPSHFSEDVGLAMGLRAFQQIIHDLKCCFHYFFGWAYQF